MNPLSIRPRASAFVATFASALLLLHSALPLAAHDPGLSTAHVRTMNERVEVTLVFAVKDAAELANALYATDDGSVTWTPAATAAALARYATNSVEAVIDDQPVVARQPTGTFDDAGNVTIHFTLAGVPQRTLRLRSTWLTYLPLGHRQFLTAQRTDGSPWVEQLLSAKEDAVALKVESSPAASLNASSKNTASSVSCLDFLGLGVKHILIGYDHLLFLFSLLIVSRSLMATLKVITAFTVAHSITLALATFDAVRIPSSIVEPLIAASIVFVALENLVRREIPPSRMWLVFGFGLIHGLGFASVLRELGVGAHGGSVVLPLVSFNLGVELGQLLVALPLVPLLAWASRRPVFERRCVPACSALAALAGGFWLVDRLLGAV